MPSNTSDQSPNVLFVINPVSGGIDKDKLHDDLERLAGKYHFRPVFFYTTGEKDEKKIEEEILQVKPDVVAAVGGDGTCNLVARVLKDLDTPMAIIPMGSANGMAKELDIPEDLEDALQILQSGKVEAIDMVRVNGQYLSMHLSDIGLNANVIKAFEEEKVRGFWGYTKQYFKALFRARPLRFYFEVDGKQHRKPAYMIVIANSRKYGTGAIINPQGDLTDGKFELVLVRPYSFWQLIGMIVPFFKGNLHELEYIDVFQGKSAKIRSSCKHTVQVDGEIIGQMDEISVEILPQKLQLTRPANNSK